MALRRSATIAAVLVVLAFPKTAWSESGNEAFARQDYAVAAELWRAEAAEGSAEAKFGLGLIHDLGLGAPRSSATALQWYLEAAGDGFADAQFNVAVMFDAGTGVPRDPATATAWYARAAANGHARAQYNLAMLYEGGVGVPRNDDLARAWYEAASPVLAAAADRLARLPPLTRQGSEGSPPQPVTGAIVGPSDAPRAELVWTAPAGSSAFRVEVARRPAEAAADAPGGDDILVSQDAERSAVVLDLPAGEASLLWRVGRDGDPPSAWSPWQELSREPVIDDLLPAAQAPSSRVTIYVNESDQLARSFAEELSAAFARGDVEVTIRDAVRPASATTVEYRHLSDAAFAASVAELLPVLRFDSAVQVSTSDIAPGEVTIRLVGGPRPPAQAVD